MLTTCAGRWISRRPKSVVGRGVDDLLEITRGSQGWSLRLDSIHHPGMVHAGTKTYERGQESKVRVVEDRWTWAAAARAGSATHDVESTFRIENDMLVLPAWIRRDSRTWLYAHDGENLEIRLEHDPRDRSEGGASLVGFRAGPSPISYAAGVRKSNATNGHDTFVTRFWQTAATGEIVELGELVEDPEWHAWFQRLHSSSTGERRWERLSDAEWRAIQSLPRAVPATAK